MNADIAAHQAHRDKIAAYFQARPFQVVRWQDLIALVGLNFMQRLSNCRTELSMNIECVPRYAIRRDATGQPHAKRITGDYRWRPHALGRDAADLVNAQPVNLFTGELSGWQAR